MSHLGYNPVISISDAIRAELTTEIRLPEKNQFALEMDHMAERVATGDHDFGVRQNEKLPSSWPRLCVKWFRSQGLLAPVENR
jgi:hypothetical protein